VPTHFAHSNATKNRRIVTSLNSRNERASGQGHFGLTLLGTASYSNAIVDVGNARLETLNVSQVVNGKATGLSFSPIKDVTNLKNQVSAFLSLALNEITHCEYSKGRKDYERQPLTENLASPLTVKRIP
jgi:hypothetical protein